MPTFTVLAILPATVGTTIDAETPEQALELAENAGLGTDALRLTLCHRCTDEVELIDEPTGFVVLDEHCQEQFMDTTQGTRITALERELADIRTKWAGAIGTISTISGYIAGMTEDTRADCRETIEPCVRDWCEVTGWSARFVGNKICLEPPR